MRPPDPALALNDDDLLSLSIGRVVRAHARVEYGLRNVHQTLDLPGAQANVASGFVGADRLVKDCLERLRLADVSREIVERGERALQAAQHASVLRNGIVHDLWLLESDSKDDVTARWNTFGAARGRPGTVVRPGPAGIKVVETARSALDRAAVSVSGLFMALHEVLPRYENSPRRRGWVSGLPIYMALMDGYFRLDDNGDWKLDAAT